MPAESYRIMFREYKRLIAGAADSAKSTKQDNQ
jgi:hypothetical protein